MAEGPRLSGAVGSANRGLSEGLLTPGMEFAMHEAQSLGTEVCRPRGAEWRPARNSMK